MFKSFGCDFLTVFGRHAWLLTKYKLTINVLKYVVGGLLTSLFRSKNRTFKVLKVLSIFTFPY